MRSKTARDEETERRLRVLANFTLDRILSMTPEEKERIDKKLKVKPRS
jgi:hypothetical protein